MKKKDLRSKEWFDNPKKHDIPEYMVEMRDQFYNCEKCEGENLIGWDSDSGTCPKCDGKMYSVSYDATLSILKNRSWQICKECNFERNTEEFKKSICCA